jgi:splicing factor 3B subunit 2
LHLEIERDLVVGGLVNCIKNFYFAADSFQMRSIEGKVRMSNDKKAKKEARKQRDAALYQKKVSFEQQLKTVGAAEPSVEYVLEPDLSVPTSSSPPLTTAEDAQPAATSRFTIDSDESSDEEDDRVQVQKRGRDEDEILHSRRKRSQPKLAWAELKRKLLDKYGPEEGAHMARLVDEHDGNAEDPLFTVMIKNMRGVVPVPHHWANKGAYLKDQVDRESADWIVPGDIEATEVRDVRVKKDQKSLNIRAFMTCFLSGSPLASKTFHVRLTRQGDVYYPGKWWPKRRPEPGVLSERLRAALGMPSATSPPPYLYGMQSLGALPPAYPDIFIPGLNAPIPAGASWGNAEGQWGNPARNEANNFLFPTVMESEYEAALRARAARRAWGSATPLVPSAAAPTASQVTAPAEPATAAAPPPSAVPPPPPSIIAPAFNEHRYANSVVTGVQNRPAFAEQEYRVVDGGTGVVAAGGTLVPRQGAALPPPPPQMFGAAKPNTLPQNSAKF